MAQKRKRFVVIDETIQTPYKTRPSDIRIREIGTAGRFGKCEVEESAGKLVTFFQTKGRWITFSITELTKYYKSKGWDPDKMFFGLSGIWYDDSSILEFTDNSWVESGPLLALGYDGRYRVTDLFIKHCMMP